MGKFFDALAKRPDLGSAADSRGPEGSGSDKKRPTVAKELDLLRGPDLLLPLQKPNSFEAEQFKLLRTQLLFPKEGEPPRTIMITSALPGEGKSFVAANLAVSIAQGINEHVLLIDCDMRRPTVHRFFGVAMAPGLCDYLNEEGLALAQVMRKTRVEKLTIVPGGEPPLNPSELLSSSKMNRLIEEVRSRYQDRYIIIDAPPPSMTAEGNAIARQVDAVVLVVRYGRTPRKMIEELMESLGKEKIAGAVLNHFNMPVFSSYSGYYGHKKYKQYYDDKKSD